MAQAKFTNALELFEPSIRIIRDSLQAYALFLVLPAALSVIGSVQGATSLGAMMSFWGGVLAILFLPPLMKLYLKTSKGQMATVEEVFNGSYKYFWRLLGLAIVVGVLVVIGLILLIIPGLILMRRYSLAAFYMVEKDMKITDAMELSAQRTKPHSWRIYDVLLVALCISLVGIAGPLGAVLSIVLSIAYSPALAIRYREINKAHNS